MPTDSRSFSAPATVQFANGTTVSAPFAGQAVQWATPPGRLRAARLPAEEDPAWLTAALTDPDLDVREQETVQVDAAAPTLAAGRLRAAPRTDVVTLRPAPPPPDRVQAVLYQDESGAMSWHFPDDFLADAAAALASAEDAEARSTRLRAAMGGRATFTIPGRTVAAQTALRSGPARSPRLRSGASRIGRKIFRVLLLPVLGHLIERPLEAIVGRIERKLRQTLIRPLAPENYNSHLATPFTDWTPLRGKRSLLVVHGILSNTEGVLSLLKRAPVERWKQHYGGRMIAYDHLTITQSPEDNVQFFLQELAAAGGPFEFDILCHSRGGIVSRTLAERGRSLVPEAQCEVKNIFFVAAPNQGSQLGDAGHIVEMLDVFTNLVNLLPNGPALYSIEILLAIVKLLAYGLEQLPGVITMGTRGYIPDVLNRGPRSTAAYAAAAASYEPKAGDLLFSLADSVLDRVFTADGRAITNDLIVPTEGVYAANGHPAFPIANPLVYQPAEALWHTELFGQDRTVERIEKHFGIAAGPALLGSPAPPHQPRLRGPVRGGLSMARSEGAPEILSSPPAHSDVAARNIELATVPAPAEELQRNPFLDFHETVREGKENELVIRLEEVAGGRDALLAIALPAGEESVDLTVSLSATGFDVAPAREQKLTVARQRDPQKEKAVFQLTARHPGAAPMAREIQADFWLGNGCIGSVTHRTTVLPAGYTGPYTGGGPDTSTPFALPRLPRRDCDLIIRVEGRDETGKPPFSIRLDNETPGQEVRGQYVGELDLAGGNLSLLFNGFLEGEFQSYPDPEGRLSDAEFDVAFEGWRQTFMLNLTAFGRHLWDLLPKDFRDEYLRLYTEGASPRSIVVHSDETSFPWELVVPYGPIGGEHRELEPLGIAHVLGRWRPGLRMRPSPQTLTVRSFRVLNPSYPPPNDLRWSNAEIERLREIIPGLTVVTPADRVTVEREVLQQPGIQILHFSGHGDYDPALADLNSIALENGGHLQAFTIKGTRLGAEAHPILYLNACSAGKSGPSVGRMGGFAESCLTSGCSGIIAPYWPINDARAADFSCALYTKLNQGRAIGEALQELRQENPDDPTFRAYAYFGDPWTQPVFPL